MAAIMRSAALTSAGSTLTSCRRMISSNVKPGVDASTSACGAFAMPAAAASASNPPSL
jgi:hypothetical protein